MTNGEKIKSIFPNIDTFFIQKDNAIDVYNLGTYFQTFDIEWWNAEYKEPTTKNNLGVDCISRADAIKAIIDHQYSNSFCEEHNIDHSINTGMALIALSDLPSVTPIRPKGHWMGDSYDYICSNCEHSLNDLAQSMDYIPFSKPKYCPNCGAKMD